MTAIPETPEQPPVADAATPRVTWTDHSGRVWSLDHDFLDFHGAGWEWTGVTDPVTGPILHSTDGSGRREPLIGLLECAGLWQLPVGMPGDHAHLMDPLDEAFTPRGEWR
ncbi:hypothetical protein [Streptomyces synnematoformans]|uniref:Uncharacterized protein n=1 Tax=Streptomyces synnematoformans TaxID=415721 RepID=A0ABN2XCJ3_9ACTN